MKKRNQPPIAMRPDGEPLALAGTHRKPESAQTREIRVVREAWQMDQPKLHTAPRWLAKALRKAVRDRRLDPGCSTASGLWNSPRYGSLFDHWGTVTRSGRKIFVTEPYAGLCAKPLAAELAEILGCEFWVSIRSWWYPGATIRIEFSESPPDAAGSRTRGNAVADAGT